MKTFKDRLILLVIVLVMLNNIEHLAHVHYQLSAKVLPVLGFDWLNKLHSVAVVIIFELVIITMAIRGRHGYAGFFSVCIWILSMVYYKVPALLFPSPVVSPALSPVVSPDRPVLHPDPLWEQALAATIYSTVFTISIYMFSKMAADTLEQEDTTTKQREKIYSLQQELTGFNELQSQLNDARASLKQAERDRQQLQQQWQEHLERLRCPYCKAQQTTEGQLRAHKGHCPEKTKGSTMSVIRNEL